MDLWSLVSVLLGSLLIMFLVVINFISFRCMKKDKERAERGQWRIPEDELLLYARLGGCIGGGLGMVLYNHKSNKQEFLELYYKYSYYAGFSYIITFSLIMLFYYMFA